MIKYLPIIILLCLGTNQLSAQEILTSLTTNEAIQHNPQASFSKKTRSLSLPFIDDFSYNGPYPDGTKWMDNKVFINNTFGVDMPTQGVATFDALNEFGLSYHPTTNVSVFKADSLTSQKITMGSYSAADSVYMSFYIQPQGNGFMPELLDSMKLLFLDANGNWQQVWGRGGIPLQNFSHIMLRIDSSIYFHNDFQFRFINLASPNTNDDVWNLDYVKIAANRTRLDTVLNDIAFAKAPSFLLAEYTSMPYRHFINNTTTELAANFNNTVQNNYKVTQTVGVNLLASELNTNTTLQTDIVNLTVPWGLPADAVYNSYAISYNPPNHNVTIQHKYFYNKLNASENTKNDTIVQKNVFANYFAYDDGSNEKAYYLLGMPNAPASTAVAFHLNQADTIRGLAIRFANQVPSGEGKLFTINLYQSLGATTQDQKEIHHQDFYKVRYTGDLESFTTYKFDSAIALAAGTYYIGTTQAPNIGADSIYFGFDANTAANANHFFYNVDGYWTPSLVSGTTMLRPIVGSNFTPTSIQTTTLEPAVQVYPNPCNNYLRLQNNCNATNYCILDVAGNTMQCNPINNQKIDVQTLPSGQYFLQLYNNQDNTLQHTSFIKQ